MVEKKTALHNFKYEHSFETLYRDVCKKRPHSYSFYNTLDIEWGEQENYDIIQKLGRGKYSEVYQGVNSKNNQMCVVKILKPVRNEKINREIKILQTLFGGPNIVKLVDVVKDDVSKTPSLIYEHIPNEESKILFPTLSDVENRIYIYKVLEALDFSHMNGIMHRDIKPLNIVVNNQERELRVIDWGLADFFIDGQEYNVRVASRYFKGPELIIEDKLYHYSLDIWSLGCTMAGMILRQEPFFKGTDNEDQLIKITRIMGTDGLYEYMKTYNLQITNKTLRQTLKSCPQVPFEAMVKPQFEHLVSEEGLDLLRRMLIYDKNKRITPLDAMRHPWFDPVRSQL